MKLLRDTYENTGTLHHAYLLEGEREAMRAHLLEFLEKTAKVPVRGNPDFWIGEYENLGVDDTRALRDMQQRKSFETGAEKGRKIFIVLATTITHEAQNSLLKSFEEPTPGTHFFLIMPSSELLLPTLRSRLVIVAESFDKQGSKDSASLAKEFLSASKAERLKLLETIIEDKDRGAAAAFLGEVEKLLHKAMPAEKMTADEQKRLHDLLKIKSYIYDRSASVKMILEYCALIVPVLR